MSNDYNLWRKRTYCYVLRNTDLFLFFFIFLYIFYFYFFCSSVAEFWGMVCFP